MANSEAGTSRDAERDAERAKGDDQVFLSFRGPDTRFTFTDFLYHGLVDAGIRVFRDEDELRFGEVIGGNLLRAIDNSTIYIPIFSRTYASSKWCLRELARIVDNVSKSNGRKSILPIFFDVEPEDLKLKTPLYGDALLEHENKFRGEVEAWIRALADVGRIKGCNVKGDQSQAEIVKSVVKMVSEKLKPKQKSVPEPLAGLDDRVKHLIELLDVHHPEARLIGIYGMGGIGKTTAAKVAFNELFSHFGKYCSFLENVRESMSTKEGIVQLQKKLLSDIVDSKFANEVKDSEQGMSRIGNILATTKVLVVLDDANNQDHIKKLIGNKPLCSGSRIIITTRNATILQGPRFKDRIIRHEMPKMDDELALQLFCRHAFGEDFPWSDYQELSKKIVSSTGGLPLAIEVIGSSLRQKSKAIWEETLDRLGNDLEEDILKSLRISYDDLGVYQKEIFLDIAWFFCNESKNDAIYMWTDCGFYPQRAIEDLISKCLIKILDNDKLWMHDQLIDMGRQIVRQESPRDLKKRSRLRIARKDLEIIRTEEKKERIEALEITGWDGSRRWIGSIPVGLDGWDGSRRWIGSIPVGLGGWDGSIPVGLGGWDGSRRWIGSIPVGLGGWDDSIRWIVSNPVGLGGWDGSIMITNEDFKRLQNLRFLVLRGGTFAGDFAECRSKLRWISWQPSYWDFKADNIYLDHLVVFKLGSNHFRDDSKAWDLIKGAPNLKVISLTDCRGITTTPDFSKCLGLERLTLAHCRNLKRIGSSIGKLQSLIELEINECSGLANLPEEVGELVNLKRFSLHQCFGLRKLPGSLGNLTSLIELDIFETMIMVLPSSIGKLKSLRILRFPLDFQIYTQDLQFTSGISALINLQKLDRSGHKEMKGEIPVEFGELSSLRILYLQSIGICGIPRTINRLHHLQTLNLRNCPEIQELPELPTSLTSLHLESKSLLSVPNLSNLTNLVDLLLSNGYSRGKESNLIPGCNLWWIWRLSRLEKLNLNLPGVPAPPFLAFLSHLEGLVLRHLDLRSLMELPSSNWDLRNLSTLELDGCEMQEIALAGLPRLEKLTVARSSALRLYISPELRELRKVSVSDCQMLVEIQFVGLLRSMQNLSICECGALTGISGLSYLKNLKTLEIRRCFELANVEGLNELEFLKYLEVGYCEELTWLIDASCTKLPDECLLTIYSCGDFVSNFGWWMPLGEGMPLKRYREEILLNTSNKVECPFTIIFHLGVKKKRSKKLEFFGGLKREKENVTPDTVTYKGLIADVKGFGFRFKRMWYNYKTPDDYGELFIEIKSDDQVKGMMPLASNRGSVHVYVEGGVDSEYEGEYNDEMMDMLREEWAMKTDASSNEDWAEWDVPNPDEDSHSASAVESEADGTSSIDDFRSEPGNADCFEATGNRRQM